MTFLISWTRELDGGLGWKFGNTSFEMFVFFPIYRFDVLWVIVWVDVVLLLVFSLSMPLQLNASRPPPFFLPLSIFNPSSFPSLLWPSELSDADGILDV